MAEITKNLNQIPNADYSSDKTGNKPSVNPQIASTQPSSTQDFSNILQKLRSTAAQPDQTGLFANKKRATSNNLQDNLLKSFQPTSSKDNFPTETNSRVNSYDLSQFDDEAEIETNKREQTNLDKTSEKDTEKPKNNLADKQSINEKGSDKALNDKLTQDALRNYHQKGDDSEITEKVVKIETEKPSLEGDKQLKLPNSKDVLVSSQLLTDKESLPIVQTQPSKITEADQSQVNQDLSKLVAAGLVDFKNLGQKAVKGSEGEQVQTILKDGSQTKVLPNNLIVQTKDSQKQIIDNQQFGSSKSGVEVAGQKNIVDSNQQLIAKQSSQNPSSTNVDQAQKNSNIDLSGFDKTNDKVNINLNKLSQLEGVKSTKVTNLDQTNLNLKGEAQLSDKQSSNLVLAQAQQQNHLKPQEAPQSQSGLGLKAEVFQETKTSSTQLESTSNNKEGKVQESLSEKVASKIIGEKQPSSGVNLATIKANENLLQNQKSVQKQQSNSQVALNSIEGQKVKANSLPQDSRSYSNNQDKSGLDKNIAKLGKEQTTDGKKTSSAETNFAQTLSSSLANKPSASKPSLIRTVQEQIVQAVRSQTTQSAQKIEIALNQSKLGKLDLKLEFEKSGALKLVIITDKAETLEMLNRDQSQLIKSLQEDGINLQKDALSFQYSGDQQTKQQDNNQDQNKLDNSKNANLEEGQNSLTADNQPNQYIDDGSIDIKV